MIFTLVSCVGKTAQKLKTGTYRATLKLMDNEGLPFIFEVMPKGKLKMFNAEEVIEVDEIRYRNDSVFINFSVFEGYIAAVFEGDKLDSSIKCNS